MSDVTTTGVSKCFFNARLFGAECLAFPDNEKRVTNHHQYNTRLSEKLRCLQDTKKELIVDLSNCKIDTTVYNSTCVFANFNIEELPFSEPTISSTSELFYDYLEDSREFSHSSEATSSSSESPTEGFLETAFDRSFTESFRGKTVKQNKTSFGKQLMDLNFERPCGGRRQQAGWWKTNSLYIITIVGFLCAIYPVYSEIMKNLSKMTKDLTSLKHKVNEVANDKMDILSRLAHVEQFHYEVKNAEANLRKNLFDLVEAEVNKVYEDKTGRADFALESAGGRVIQLSPGTENYGGEKSSLFGVSLCESMHGPRAMIQMGIAPGECWAIKGSQGGAIIKLLGSIKINAVSVEHISKSISPSGDSTTSPKDFAVWGLSSPNDKGQLLGQFVYRVPGPLVQTFTINKPSDRTFDYVEFKVLSNNGNPEFTCVYRLRIHGTLDMSSTRK